MRFPPPPKVPLIILAYQCDEALVKWNTKSWFWTEIFYTYNIRIFKYIYIYLEPHMTPIFEGQPPQNKAFFPFKTRAKIWVVGIFDFTCKSKTWQMIVFRMMPCFQDSLRSQLTNNFSWKTRGVFSEYTASNRWFSGDMIVFQGVFKYLVVEFQPLKLKIYLCSSQIGCPFIFPSFTVNLSQTTWEITT